MNSFIQIENKFIESELIQANKMINEKIQQKLNNKTNLIWLYLLFCH